MQTLKQNDKIVIDSIEFQEVSTYSSIKDFINKIIVEINVYDIDASALIETIYEPLLTLVNNNYISFTDSNKQITIDTELILRSKNYDSGNFRVTYKFCEDILGSSQDGSTVIIDKISASRKEILVKYINGIDGETFKSISEKHFYQFSSDFAFNKFANFGSDILSVILNAKNQFDSIRNINTLALKLYDKLPMDFTENSVFWITKLYSDEITDTITLLQSFLRNLNVLRSLNTSVRIDDGSSVYTDRLTFNDILDSSNYGDGIYEQQISATDNSGLYGIELNTDYSKLENFVHFGSAANMLSNFKTKVENIQYYYTQSLSFGNVQGNTTSLYSSSANYKNTITDYIKEFTRFERFMYFNTSSYFSSSVEDNGLSSTSPYNTFCKADGATGNLIIDSTWPKTGTVSGSGYPYIVASSTDATVSAWLDLMMINASNYDTENRDYLLNTVPEYIRNDIDSNMDYISFINMIGEFYDNIWVYINAYYTTLKSEHKLSESVPNELLWDILKNKGLNVNNSKNAVDLGKYLYGLYPSGSSDNYIVDVKRSQKEITLEIWNRLLNNLPYLYKSKGTKKSILSLLNCYGVPTDLLTIREFGGPYANVYTSGVNVYTNTSSSYEQKYEFVVNDFTHVVDMTGNEYISVPWVTSSYFDIPSGEVPDTIELKFRSKYSGDGYITIFDKIGVSATSSFSLRLHKSVTTSHEDHGYLELLFKTGSGLTDTLIKSASTSIYPFFDGNFYNVFVTRDESSEAIATDDINTGQNYRLTVKKFDEDTMRILINTSSFVSVASSEIEYNSCWIDSGSMYLGGNSSNKFVGSFDEFRLWSEELRPDVMNWHSQYWPATNGNTFDSSILSLQFRLSFNNPVNLFLSTSLYNEAYSTSSYYSNAIANGFTSNPVVTGSYPYHFSTYDRSSLVQNNFVAPSSANSSKIRIEVNTVSQSITLPDNYVVTPLRVPSFSNYKNLISDKSNGYIEILGEQSPFKLSAQDSDLLLIGFAPAQMINNDMIAFFGNSALLSGIGDPLHIYENNYPPVDNMNNQYWTYSKTKTRFSDYIQYIQMYDTGLFDQIKKVVPAQATTIFGTVYEPTMIHRSRVRLIHPETAFDYDYGSDNIPGVIYPHGSGNNLYKDTNISLPFLPDTFGNNLYKNANITLPILPDVNGNNISTDTNIDIPLVHIKSDMLQIESNEINLFGVSIDSINVIKTADINVLEKYFKQIESDLYLGTIITEMRSDLLVADRNTILSDVLIISNTVPEIKILVKPSFTVENKMREGAYNVFKNNVLYSNSLYKEGSMQEKVNKWNFVNVTPLAINTSKFTYNRWINSHTVSFNPLPPEIPNTPDGGKIIEILKNNAKQLMVNYSNNPKLIIE